MNQKFVFFSLCSFMLFGSALQSDTLGDRYARPQADGKTLVLYDAASGTLPDAPLMNFTDFPPGASVSVFSGDATNLDTTRSGQDTYAGWSSIGASIPDFPILDRSAGFQVDFTLQVEEESHRRNNRSGLSLIVLGEDARGIELAFWENEIWAQNDNGTGGLFQHGEGVNFPTTTGLIAYRLSITGDTYTLTANADPILTGAVRDYSAFDGFPDPYQTPNFLFLGDNTTSAQARIRLRFVSITGTDPVTSTPTVIATETSTKAPAPEDTQTPLPTSSPVPSSSPTPGRRSFEFCNAGSFILVLMITNGMLLKYMRQKNRSYGEIGPEANRKG